MNLSLFLLTIFTLIGAFSNSAALAKGYNCDSPVWRSRPLCAGKSSNKKYIQYGSWFPFGFDKNGNAVNFVQLLSYKKLNKNSFRLKSKFTDLYNQEIEGRLDINCENKDYYIRPNGVMSQRATWASIPKGSGIEILSKYLCKKTAAKDKWGYTKRTSYLWGESSPLRNPSEASGEWIQHSDGLGWYNTEIRKSKNSVIYAYFTKSQSKTPYVWVNNSCIENLGSVFFKPNNSVNGEWLSPKAGRVGGANEFIRQLYCD